MEEYIKMLIMQCCAYTANGAPCSHNNASIVGKVWYKGTVCYGIKSLPSMYVGAGWMQGVVRVCGTHARMLREGKGINMHDVVHMVSHTLPGVPNGKGVTCTKGHMHPTLEDVRACYGAPMQEQRTHGGGMRSGDWYERKDNVRTITNPYLRGEYLYHSKGDAKRAAKLRRHGNNI